jgi:hypothetical protein
MNNETTEEYIYAGLAGIEPAFHSFNLGNRIEIRKTFAHIFSANMVAFAPPGPEGFHGGPWKAAKGGFGYDITAEIRVPRNASFKSIESKELLWLIGALLRLIRYPYLSIPVFSTISFNQIAKITNEPILTPFEVEPRILKPLDDKNRKITVKDLAWVGEYLGVTVNLIKQNPEFYSAFKVFDAATIRGKAASSLLSMWGGLEQLFVPSSAELRFRTAAYISSFLESPGKERLALFKQILKLYNERSIAAHSAQEIQMQPLIHTFVIMRNVLVKIIKSNKIPKQNDLEEMLLCGKVNTGSRTN